MLTRPALWLWLLVAVQVAIPASYYLRAERDDERFAWRMFSAVRLRRCEVSAYDVHGPARRRVDVPHALHASWIRSLERGRPNVIDRFLATRCAFGAQEAQLERRCHEPSGAVMEPMLYRHVCEAP
ncbi:MAG TPA: hypothetical protein VFX59_07955 [Polyangiales bacterium]|nr:hypothetical protein [Polyangiales bacterium]